MEINYDAIWTSAADLQHNKVNLGESFFYNAHLDYLRTPVTTVNGNCLKALIHTLYSLSSCCYEEISNFIVIACF